MLRSPMNRKSLADWYGQEFLRVRGNPNGRWFDKTPQNVYGILLIRAIYPKARFIHIHRSPLNVVSSLREGKVMPGFSLNAGINAWMESMMILSEFKQLDEGSMLEVPYEQVTAQPKKYIKKCLDFLEEDDRDMDYSSIHTHPEKHKYKKILSREEIDLVLKSTEPYCSRYGYGNTA